MEVRISICKGTKKIITFSPISHVWTAEWFYNLLMGAISFLYIWKADWRKRVI